MCRVCVIYYNYYHYYTTKTKVEKKPSIRRRIGTLAQVSVPSRRFVKNIAYLLKSA